MASHLSAIGFPVASEEEFRQLVAQAAESGLTLPGGLYSRWSPGEGIELWVQLRGREPVGFNPHFAGTGRMRVTVSNVRPDPDYPSEGKVHAFAEPGGSVGLVFDVPDFEMVKAKLQTSPLLTVQLAAFAHDLTCYESDEGFRAAQWGLTSDPESFIAVDPVDAGGSEGDEPGALALVAGHVNAARIATNPVTGLPFHVLSVQTVGGTVDMVADPDSVKGTPVAGGVVQGTFWLSGRIVPEVNRRGIFPIPPN